MDFYLDSRGIFLKVFKGQIIQRLEVGKRVYAKEMLPCCLDTYRAAKSPPLQVPDSPPPQKAMVMVAAILGLGIEFR